LLAGVSSTILAAWEEATRTTFATLPGAG